ncbi:DUF6455 family protein [Rhodosalinus sp.]|uniref:DUF6455 family protein n=1 Tax=Rhodosalinus sp. TaxID=2047741 RepID=UPI00397E02E3
MQSDNILKHHAALVDRMAGRLGLDLEEVALRGKLSVDEIGDAVLTCTGCSRPGDCARWLDAQDEAAAHPPGYCRNAELFARLTPV